MYQLPTVAETLLCQYNHVNRVNLLLE